MRLTKYISTNILSLLGILIFILSIPFVITSSTYNGTNIIYGVSLFEQCAIYIIFILTLITLIPIEMLFHKITHDKFIINIPFKDKEIKHIYIVLFWLGITVSISYLMLFIWFMTR